MGGCCVVKDGIDNNCENAVHTNEAWNLMTGRTMCRERK